MSWSELASALRYLGGVRASSMGKPSVQITICSCGCYNRKKEVKGRVLTLLPCVSRREKGSDVVIPLSCEGSEMLFTGDENGSIPVCCSLEQHVHFKELNA